MVKGLLLQEHVPKRKPKAAPLDPGIRSTRRIVLPGDSFSDLDFFSLQSLKGDRHGNKRAGENTLLEDKCLDFFHRLLKDENFHEFYYVHNPSPQKRPL